VTLIGNKLDLVEQRKVTSNEAEAFGQLHQLAYFETSALGGDNIQEAFHRTTGAILRRNIGGSTPDRYLVQEKPEVKPCPC
jgi:hypothetical protein